MAGTDDDALARWIRAVVPHDAGHLVVKRDLQRVGLLLDGERPEWRARFEALSARVPPEGLMEHQADPEVRWFARIVARVHLADAAAWATIGWEPTPGGFPDGSDIADEVIAALTSVDRLASEYDAVVVGSGAGGSVAAQEFAEAGYSVLVVERGTAPPGYALAGDHLRNPRVEAGLESLAGPRILGNPRVLADGSIVDPTDSRWGNNAMTLGGGTRVYGGQAWRFAPEDFRMASTYGVPNGSALADWPISYDELEPFYSHAEFEWGVSGAPGDPETEGFRSSPFPLPPMPRAAACMCMRKGAAELGWNTLPVPLLINSEPYRGRPACVRCAQCVGFACPVGARAGAQNTTLQRAARTGRLEIVTDAQAVRLTADGDGRVTGVVLRGANGEGPWEREVRAGEVALAAGAIETARLLLASPTTREPDGIGNTTDQVGRHLQAHIYAGAVGIFDNPVQDRQGPGPSIATNRFRHHNDGIVGGGMLANDFVPTPASALGYLQDAGLLAYGGSGMLDDLAHLMPRMQRIVGPVQEMTTADARVTLDPTVTDGRGMPVARLSGDVHAEDLRVQAFLTDRAGEWLEAAGATTVVPLAPRRMGHGPSVGQHQAGTCRMGDDPATSVVDAQGRVWGHSNLRIVDGSTHVTNGGVNPVLTTIANAYRIMDAAVGVRESEDAFSE